MTTFEALKANIEKHGAEKELIVAMEECAELIQAISKVLRNGLDDAISLDHLAEEMADVEIVLAELKLIFDNESDIEGWKRLKLTRLRLHIDDKKSLCDTCENKGCFLQANITRTKCDMYISHEEATGLYF